MIKKIFFVGIFIFIVLIVVAFVTTEGFATLGSAPQAKLFVDKADANHYRDSRFHNPGEKVMRQHRFFSVLTKFLLAPKGQREPLSPLPIEPVNSKALKQSAKNDVRITWLGHAALLIEIDGFRLLTDPVFSKRASPMQWMGPARFHPVPIDIDAIPMLDAIIISHDHYDHLDYHTIKRLAPKTHRFFVPLGVASHLISWGIEPSKIVERDWWQKGNLDGVISLIAKPAQHFSGRSIFDRNKTLWTSWVIMSKQHRIYFSGDTGMFDAFKEIGERYGPFDFTLLHVGAYADEWPEMHMNPEQAVQAHLQLKGKVFVPIHWGTFNLAFHNWNEPAERLYKVARDKKLNFVIPKAGQHIFNSDLQPVKTWWRTAGK